MKLGASILLNFEDENKIIDFMDNAYKFEFDVIEIVAEPPFCFIDQLTQEDIRELKKKALDYNLELTVHSTFSDVNIAAINKNVRAFVQEEIKKNLTFAANINAEIVTIHPGDYGAIGHSYPDLTNKYNNESLKLFTNYAETLGIKIGYENMPYLADHQFKGNCNIDKIINTVEMINSEVLGITWDVGHSHTLDYDLETCFNTFKERLYHIHIHDNLGVIEGWRDTHLSLGEGTINWKLFFDLIKDYKSTIVFELSSWKKIKQSLEYLSTIKSI